jgi:predicted O-methyltransferase YrrM
MHLPMPFRRVPASLQITVAQSTPQELEAALKIRRAFNLPGWNDPYMNDIVRAFRLAQGKKVYIEIGSRDKGNVAWLAAHVLADDATIIELDIEEFPQQERLLREYLKPRQTHHRMTGDCLSDDILSRIQFAMGGEQADIVFCDTLHEYQHTLAEFDAYFPLVKPGGFLIFHDCYFEGSVPRKGKSQALSHLDRLVTVYAVFAEEPTHRHLPRETNDDVWGGCGIILKDSNVDTVTGGIVT